MLAATRPAFSRFMLGNAAADVGNLASSQQLAEESLGDFRMIGDDHMVLWATRHLAWTCDNFGDECRLTVE